MSKNDADKKTVLEKINNFELPENFKETEQYKNWIRFEHSSKNYYPYEENKFLFKKIISKTYLNKSKIENGGYGVFASEKINAGDLIEEAPFVVLETTHKLNNDIKLRSYGYSYCYGENSDKENTNIMIPFGNFLCYNHSIQPNAYYIQDDNFKLVRMFAYEDIEKDEEITWYYSPGYSEYLRQMKYQTEEYKDYPYMHYSESFKNNK